ncbi:cytochrome c oxidase assembly protein COX20, mitochondrial-like [Amphiura filiformis]|uniref:cytochrome c oxidase assembly protein COX20, mitochondrial-like n=1 Tax=Amphiura filiformis TaxID=82378 RepID=UPI003B2233BF
MASNEIDDDQKKGLFSKVTEPFHTVPCTRTAYLHGFASGLLSGVSTFLFTSNVRKASNLGVVTFALIMPGSFFYCRWKNFKKELEKQRSTPATIAPWRPDDESSDVTNEMKET